MTGRLLGCSVTSDGQHVILRVDTDVQLLMNKFYDKELEILIQTVRNKRSLTANGYMWALLQRLAEALETSKEEVYTELVRRMGYCIPTLVPQADRETFERAWHSQGLGYQTEHISDTKTGECELMCYYGSSAYDTKQFSRLLDEVILECREADIPTDTPDKIAYYKALYEEEYNRKGS